VEHEERSMRGERYEAGEAMAQMPERFREATERMGRTMQEAQAQTGQMAERARETMGAARARMTEMGGRMGREPGTMWFLGLAALAATLIGVFMLFYPWSWRRAGDYLGEKYGEYAGGLRGSRR